MFSNTHFRFFSFNIYSPVEHITFFIIEVTVDNTIINIEIIYIRLRKYIYIYINLSIKLPFKIMYI